MPRYHRYVATLVLFIDHQMWSFVFKCRAELLEVMCVVLHENITLQQPAAHALVSKVDKIRSYRSKVAKLPLANSVKA
jgi:hypothetical protein